MLPLASVTEIMASILNYFKLSSEKRKENNDTAIEIDKQATSEQSCSSLAAGDLDRVNNSDCEDSCDDCEVQVAEDQNR